MGTYFAKEQTQYFLEHQFIFVTFMLRLCCDSRNVSTVMESIVMAIKGMA
jgi:hypothetical protein